MYKFIIKQNNYLRVEAQPVAPLVAIPGIRVDLPCKKFEDPVSPLCKQWFATAVGQVPQQQFN